MFTSAYVELDSYILSFLGPKDICQCLQVCKYFNKLGKEDEVWEKFAKEIIDLNALNQNKSIKGQYKKIIIKMTTSVNQQTPLFRSLYALREALEIDSKKEKKSIEVIIKDSLNRKHPEYVACLLSIRQRFIDDSINSKSCSFEFLLYEAIKTHSLKLVRLLLNTIPFPPISREVFVAAIQADRFKTTKMLLEKGANPNIGDGEPLTCALQHKNLSIVELLLKKGANPNLGREHPLIKVLRNSKDRTIDVRLFSTLLFFGADPSRNEIPIIIEASRCIVHDTANRIKMLKLLLKTSKQRNQKIIDQCDDHRQTALMHSIKEGNSGIIDFLIEHGANLDAKDCNGKSVLSYAKDRDLQDKTNTHCLETLILSKIKEKSKSCHKKSDCLDCLIS